MNPPTAARRIPWLCLIPLLCGPCGSLRAGELTPNIVVAGDGGGDFRTIQQALASVPRGRQERIVILIKDGVYREKLRIDASCLTLRGQSRKGSRIEFPQLLVEFEKTPDRIGRAVVNIEGDDVVLENLTASNTAAVDGPQAASTFGRHAFTVFGRGDRTVLLDCDLLSEGADTVSLWQGRRGRYYHARCHFRGGVDLLCPRGWCYVTDCSVFETRRTAALWHDGSQAKSQKLVIRNSSFDGVEGWQLGRHHRDAQFYLLGCTFSASMADHPLALHRYNDAQKDRQLGAAVRWGERCYYQDCHRAGGDYSWHRDNSATADGSPKPDAITAAWTFGGTWDPETTAGPLVKAVDRNGAVIKLTFNEPVTIRGKPRLRGASGAEAEYVAGSGSEVVTFRGSDPVAGRLTFVLDRAQILGSLATARFREANLSLAPGE
jgi:pectinesterase